VQRIVKQTWMAQTSNTAWYFSAVIKFSLIPNKNRFGMLSAAMGWGLFLKSTKMHPCSGLRLLE